VFNTATYVHNRTPTRVLGGCTLFEVGYGAKPALCTCAFGAPSTVIQPLEDLRKLVFVDYKYKGSGFGTYSRWLVVVESRDVVCSPQLRFCLAKPNTSSRALYVEICLLQKCVLGSYF